MKIKSKYLEKIKEKVDLKTAIIIAVSFIVGITLFISNFLYIKGQYHTLLFSIINIFAILIIIGPVTVIQYTKYKRISQIEEKFPDFLRDVVEGIRGGMSLPLAIKYASRNKYGYLDEYIKRLVAQISWGIPFEEALNNFGKSVGSYNIKRAVSTIIQAHRSGGELGEVLNSVSESVVEIDKIRRERSSKHNSQMMTGDIIFFVFIGVMVGLEKFLLPALKFGAVGITGGIPAAPPETKEVLGKMFINLAVIQGAFSGLSIGKLAEGRISAGIKHSVILSLIGYTVLTIV
jgi:flagellar protein FlaJ